MQPELTTEPPAQFGSADLYVSTSNCRPLSFCASTRLPNGIDTQGRPIKSLDWGGDEVEVYDGKSTSKYKDIIEAANNSYGCIFIFEATADSYEVRKRLLSLDAIKRNNIIAYCFNPKFTSKYRIEWGVPKTDKNDARVIYRIFTETNVTCVKFKPLVDKNKEELRSAVNNIIIVDRRNQSTKTFETAAKYAPTHAKVPEQMREWVYLPTKSKKPKKYKFRKQIGRVFQTAEQVITAGRGYRQFKRQMGSYGQGFGCIMRSELHHWLIRAVLNARLKKAGVQKKKQEGHVNPKTQETVKYYVTAQKEEKNKIKKQVLRDKDKMLKWVWRTVKDSKV